jgi:hypothetical protein
VLSAVLRQAQEHLHEALQTPGYPESVFIRCGAAKRTDRSKPCLLACTGQSAVDSDCLTSCALVKCNC